MMQVTVSASPDAAERKGNITLAHFLVQECHHGQPRPDDASTMARAQDVLASETCFVTTYYVDLFHLPEA